MSQVGIVESVNKDHVFVTVVREGACAHCRMCTTGINEGKECLIEAVNQCNATVGDQVNIDLQPHYFLQATAIIYGIPLIAMLVGMSLSLLITNRLGISNAEVISAVIGIVFTGITYLWINKREKNNKNMEYLPVAISIRKEE